MSYRRHACECGNNITYVRYTVASAVACSPYQNHTTKKVRYEEYQVLLIPILGEAKKNDFANFV